MTLLRKQLNSLSAWYEFGAVHSMPSNQLPSRKKPDILFLCVCAVLNPRPGTYGFPRMLWGHTAWVHSTGLHHTSGETVPQFPHLQNKDDDNNRLTRCEAKVLGVWQVTDRCERSSN